MTYIPTEKVESTNIEEIGYHRATSTLRIIFQGNRAYDYPMVPEPEFKKLMAAESKGKFFNSRIKPMYAHATVRPEQLQPPKEACCVHPGKPCNDEDCGRCDPGCCPQDRAQLGRVVADGLERGKQLIDEARAQAAGGIKDDGAESAEAEARSHALNAEDDAKACQHPNTEATSDGTIVGCATCGADLSPDDEKIIHLNTCADPCLLDHSAPPKDSCPCGDVGRDCESGCGCGCHTGASD